MKTKVGWSGILALLTLAVTFAAVPLLPASAAVTDLNYSAHISVNINRGATWVSPVVRIAVWDHSRDSWEVSNDGDASMRIRRYYSVDNKTFSQAPEITADGFSGHASELPANAHFFKLWIHNDGDLYNGPSDNFHVQLANYYASQNRPTTFMKYIFLGPLKYHQVLFTTPNFSSDGFVNLHSELSCPALYQILQSTNNGATFTKLGALTPILPYDDVFVDAGIIGYYESYAAKTALHLYRIQVQPMCDDPTTKTGFEILSDAGGYVFHPGFKARS